MCAHGDRRQELVKTLNNRRDSVLSNTHVLNQCMLMSTIKLIKYSD